MKKIFASHIAEFLEQELCGSDVTIESVKAIDEYKDKSISFLTKYPDEDLFSRNGLLIISDKIKLPSESCSSYIISKNPRLDVAKIVDKFFNNQIFIDLRDQSFISEKASLAKDVIIGANCYIGDRVVIGSGTIINHNVVISGKTKIGQNCYFKSGSVIGEDGFGFDFDNDRTPIRIPHIGKVVISDDVEIGANNTVVRATYGTTIIGKNTKTDDHVHIAHNCKIGENCIITASAELSGSVNVGHDVWIGPNSSIMNNITLGNYSMIGLGSVVTKNIPEFCLTAGSPARQLGWMSKTRKRLELPIKTEKPIRVELDGNSYVLEGSMLKLEL